MLSSLSFLEQTTKRTKRSNTLQSQPCPRVTSSLHEGLNYFHELHFPQMRIRKAKKSKVRSHSMIQDTQIYETLQDNKQKLGRIKTQVNQMRDIEFNQYIKKSIRYQELLNINDIKRKRLTTMNTKIGAVVKKSASQAYPKDITFKIRANTLKIQGWKPQSRQGHTTIVFRDQLMLIGGHCSHPFKTIHVYSFFSNTWTKHIECEIPRSYHSTILYKNRFAITFGGMGIYNKSRKSRECYNSISLLDLQNLTTRSFKMHNQQSIQPRRCHTATLLGKTMIVLGGINSKKQYLSDFVYLDLKQLRWYHKEYKVQGKDLEEFLQFGIAKHAAVSTFTPRKSYAFYSSQYQEHEGIFFFGGYNQRQESNTVFQLSLGQFVPTFRSVETMGSPPSPVNPITEWYNDNTILIISGQMSERQLRLFKVRQRSFVIINDYNSMHMMSGLSSTINIYGGQYYLFYGLNQEGYIGQISKFSIMQEIKQSDKKSKRKYFDKNDFMLRVTNYGEITDSDQQNF